MRAAIVQTAPVMCPLASQRSVPHVGRTQSTARTNIFKPRKYTYIALTVLRKKLDPVVVAVSRLAPFTLLLLFGELVDSEWFCQFVIVKVVDSVVALCQVNIFFINISAIFLCLLIFVNFAGQRSWGQFLRYFRLHGRSNLNL